jgi:hypothetical protein
MKQSVEDDESRRNRCVVKKQNRRLRLSRRGAEERDGRVKKLCRRGA